MGRPRSTITAVAVAFAIAAREDGRLPVTAIDVATDLDICRKTVNNLLVRETGMTFGAFRRRHREFLPTSADVACQGDGVVEMKDISNAAERVPSRDARTSVATERRHAWTSFPGVPPR